MPEEANIKFFRELPSAEIPKDIFGCPKQVVACNMESDGVSQLERVAQAYKENNVKPSNPKDALGIRKPPQSTLPQNVLAEVGVAMLEGALKYGRHNFRVIGVRGSVYYDAARRHIDSWWEGEDIDPDSGMNHITKAITSLVVLRDAMLNNMWTDDRPPKSDVAGHRLALMELVEKLFEKYPEPKEAYVALGDGVKQGIKE